MELSSRLICFIVILYSMAYKVNAIQCYYCNSANNSACLNLNEYDDETRARLIPVVNCETAIPSPVSHKFFCRKIVQTIFHSHRDSDVRVTRGCGWVPHHRDCYKADNSDHLETACQCFSDHCNAADSVDPATATVLFLMLSACLYFLR